MKKTVLSLMSCAALCSAQGQLFSPEALSGAALGAILGGIAGADARHGLSGNGAAIGAGIGLVAGAIAGEVRRQDVYGRGGSDWVGPAEVSFGYGYGSCRSAVYVHYAPNRYCAPGWYYRPERRPDYVLGGTLLGAASGALIGAGTGDAGLGAAIGAASGLILGSVAEAAARERERKSWSQAQAAVDPPAVSHHSVSTPAQPAQPRIARSPTEVTSKPCASSTYFWTRPPEQIADAPRVPDAPRF